MNFGKHEVILLRKPYRRSIGITLQVNGSIRLTAPKTIPVERIEAFLTEHSNWIDTNLAKYRGLRERHPPKLYVHGERFPFFGEMLPLRFRSAGDNLPRLSAVGGELVMTIPEKQWLGFKLDDPHPELTERLADEFAAIGKKVIDERVAHFSALMKLWPTSVSFRSQKTRWGSCSSNGRISLNWRLVIAPIEVIDYVVVHELAHLRHYNHSLGFWNLVASEIPDHAAKRGWLREHQFAADFLAKRSELHEDARTRLKNRL